MRRQNFLAAFSVHSARGRRGLRRPSQVNDKQLNIYFMYSLFFIVKDGGFRRKSKQIMSL